MPRVSCSYYLQGVVDSPETKVAGATVRECLEAYFQQFPAARSYVLDDQGELRRHMVIFIGGQTILDRRQQSDPIAPDEELFIAQALSGG